MTDTETPPVQSIENYDPLHNFYEKRSSYHRLRSGCWFLF